MTIHLTEEDIEREAREHLRQMIFQKIRNVRNQDAVVIQNRDAVVWLSLPPVWTVDIALASEFPEGKRLEVFLETAVRNGLAATRTRRLSDGTEGRVFWMPQNVRRMVLAELLKNPGPNFLRKEAVEIGNGIMRAAENTKLFLPPVLARWARLASEGGRGMEAGARWLIGELRKLVKKGETGEALAWVETAKDIAMSLGGKMESAVLLGNRHLELAYRLVHDKLHIEKFLERGEQIREFERLLDPNRSQDTWALHFAGMGGVGKTMLMRYISAELVPGRGGCVGRIDFDYLSPDYPVRKPAQLLLELADELSVYADVDYIDRAFRSFEYHVLDLHETLSAEPPPENPLGNIRRREFNRVLRAFVEVIGFLPKPVVFILDTCEELAKSPPSGGSIPNVEATFEILEKIHEGTPYVRVVLAGRRMLSRAGVDWHIIDGGEGKNRMLPAEKKYLRLHEIRGFCERPGTEGGSSEVDKFFARWELDNLSKQMREIILKKSRETGTVADIVWDTPPRETGGKRYNPFDLALYADWLKQDPDSSADIVAADSADPYIEMRIVRRIKREEIRAALPAAVLLRRFDLEMLRPALTVSGMDAEEIYLELSAQEWMNRQRDKSVDSTFLEIDRNLWSRLYQYFDRPEFRLGKTREKLASGLEKIVRERSFSNLSHTHVVAVLRLSSPEKAAILWRDIELRAAEKARWGWLREVAENVLGPDGPVPDRDHPLYPGVMATHVSAMIHTDLDYDPTDGWNAVSETASNYPVSESDTYLGERAICGLAAASKINRKKPSERAMEDFATLIKRYRSGADFSESAREQNRQIVASLLAAAEAMIEYAETDRAFDLPEKLFSLMDRFSETPFLLKPDEHLGPFDDLLAAKLLLLRDRFNEAFDRFGKALEKLPNDFSSYQKWLDLRIPTVLRYRIWLERLRALRFSGLLLETRSWPEVGKYQGDAKLLLDKALKMAKTVDGERLASKILQLSLHKGPISIKELEAYALKERYSKDRRPECNAHRETPPLRATLALAISANGSATKALDMIDQRIKECVSSSTDEQTVRSMGKAKLKIIREMRLFRRGAGVVRGTAKTTDPEKASLAWPIVLLNHPYGTIEIPQPDDDFCPRLLHHWWRCQAISSPDAARSAVEALLRLAGQKLDNSKLQKDDFAYQCLLMDLSEADATLEHFGFGDAEIREDVRSLLSILDQIRSSAPRSLESFIRNSRIADDDTLRLVIRSYALKFDEEASEVFRDIFGKVTREMHPVSRSGSFGSIEDLLFGRGRFATQIAMDEGELLAFRLPNKALRLLRLAHDGFENGHDLVGAAKAAILCGLTAIRTKDVDSATREILDRTYPAFDRLNKSGILGGFPDRETEFELYDIYTDLDKPPESKDSDGSSELEIHDMHSDSNKPPKSTNSDGSSEFELYDVHTDPKKQEKPKRMTFAQSAWLEWIHRLCVCEIWIDSRKKWENESVFSLPNWILERYDGRAPLELDVLGTSRYKTETSVEHSKEDHYGETTKGSSQSEQTEDGPDNGNSARPVETNGNHETPRPTDLFAAFAVAMVLLGTSLLFYQINGEKLIILSPWITAICAFPAFLYFATKIAKDAWRAYALSRADVCIRVEGSAEYREHRLLQDQAVEAAMDLDLKGFHFAFKAPFYYYRENPLIAGRCIAPGVRPYNEAARNMPPNVVSRLSAFRLKLRSKKLPVALELSSDMEAFAWEAALNLADNAISFLSRREPLQFYRISYTGNKAPFHIEKLKKRIDLGQSRVSVLYGERNWPAIREGWEAMADRLVPNIGERLQPSEAWKNTKIIHLVGLPVQTSAGVRVQTNSSGHLESNFEQKEAYERQGDLTAPDVFSNMRHPVAIIQAEPSEPSPYRTDTERETMGYLRQFAAEVFALGASAVLVLPPLPSELSLRTTRKIADVLHHYRKVKLRRLVDLADELRAMIAKYPFSSSGLGYGSMLQLEGAGPKEDFEEAYEELAMELAYDVILYLRL